MMSLRFTFASFLGASFYFALFFVVENLFTSYLLLFDKKIALEYIIKFYHFFHINNLLITSKETSPYGFAAFSSR